jgi:D-glutamate cyclase
MAAEGKEPPCKSAPKSLLPKGAALTRLEGVEVEQVERAVARDVGRGSGRLARYTAGNLRKAARSLLETPAPHVAIVTGFYVPGAPQPAAETDGPVGAVQLAAAIHTLGGSARILTDEPCAPVLAAAMDAAKIDAALDVAPLRPSRSWEKRIVARYRESLTHMVAIERVGPSASGPPRNMRGEDVSAWTAPLERVYRAGDWVRIAIGDGGNEIGMGALPREPVAEIVAHGALIHCTVPCDALVFAGTSNWGAAGLTAALAALHPTGPPEFAALLDPLFSHRVLAQIVTDAGAVDGVLRAAVPSVDGLSWDSYVEVLEEIRVP